MNTSLWSKNDYSLCNYPGRRILFHIYFILFFILTASYATMGQDVLVGLTSTGGSLNGGTSFNLKTTGASFAVHRKFMNVGNYPLGDLVKGTDGYFYGMTNEGGNNGSGTIFKMSSGGTITLLRNLSYSDGASPHGSLIQATDGNFYGMTSSGGSKYNGTIFKIAPSGTFTILKNLDGTTTGGNPYGSLVQGSDGNFYGMTYGGGTLSYGTIFKMAPDGTFTVLKSFDYNSTGGYPYGGLVEGAAGVFYGMTNQGGASSYGTIFKITSTGAFTVLKNLSYNTTGSYPQGSLTKGNDGNFYGMTNGGGSAGSGTIFKITPDGIFTLLKNLDYNTTGSNPQGSLVKGSDGNFYGMAKYNGLLSSGTNGKGTIFKITPGGTFTILKVLDGINTGSYPCSGLVEGVTGTFYGMTPQSGSDYNGTVFKITSTGTFSLLMRFPDGAYGSSPSESLIQANDGNYYGMATNGGKYGNGSIYKLCTNGSYTALRSLDGTTTGGHPQGSLVQGSDGNFYGATHDGGAHGYGTIFKMSSSGTLTVLKNLDNTSGYNPNGGLVEGTNGTFYGVTSTGGSNFGGTIFSITSAGTYTVLKNLDNTSGTYPEGSLIKAKDGYFYGTTSQGGATGGGTIFRITASGTFSVLKNLDGTTGNGPNGDLIQGIEGNFYGLMTNGGPNGYGTIFKFSAATNSLTVLVNLSKATTGGYPKGNLVQGSDSTLYGMTSQGGTYGGGTIFKIKPNGSSFAVLRHLNPATDGSAPLGSLVIQKTSPVATAQSFSLVENTSKKVKLTATGGSPLTYAISTAPLHGTATITKDSLTYTPAANYVGSDSLYFTATWGCQKSAPAKIKITVTAATVMGTAISNEDNPDRQQQRKLLVKAIPNPSSTYFTVLTGSSSAKPLTIKVIDAMGRIVEQKGNISANGSVIIGENYRAGLYYVEVVQDGEKEVLKVVKQ